MNRMETNRGTSTNNQNINVGKAERWASVIGGAALAVDGIRRKDSYRGVELLLGAMLVYRGASGECKVYEAFNVNTADDIGSAADLEKLSTVDVNQIFTINRPPQELYEFWKHFENLPRIMEHLESAERLNDDSYRFKACGPAGSTIEWEAEITEQVPNELIAWRSIEGSDIANRGSVRFRPAPEGRGTEVEVRMQYAPTGGKLANTVAKLFGKDPEREIREGLRRFKQLMEAGEIATTDGQPTGPK